MKKFIRTALVFDNHGDGGRYSPMGAEHASRAAKRTEALSAARVMDDMDSDDYVKLLRKAVHITAELENLVQDMLLQLRCEYPVAKGGRWQSWRSRPR